MEFTNKKAEKEFGKIDSSTREKIEFQLKKDPILLTGSTNKLRGGNWGYRVKYKKHRIFYEVVDYVILIYKVGQKDKKAYEGI